MNKILYSLFLLLIMTKTVQAQVGKSFPNLVCATLDEEKLTLPTDLDARKSVLCLAYSQKAEEKLQVWINKAIPKFVLRSSETSLFPLEPYDVNTYFVAMYTGLNKAVAKKATEQIKTSIDVLLHPYILTYTGEIEPYKTALKMENKDDPYIFVLDEKGKVIYATSGAYTDKSMDEIEDLISDDE
jgi:hypothetical protein